MFREMVLMAVARVAAFTDIVLYTTSSIEISTP